MTYLNRHLILTALSVLFFLGTASAQDLNAIAVSTLQTSNCLRADIELVAQASGVRKEAYRVTSSGKEFDYSSAALSAPQSSISGAITRSITLPAAAASDSLIGVSYILAGDDLNDKNAAHFFVVYSCTHVTPVYTCTGNRETCPETIEEYLPHLGRRAYSSRGEFGVIADRSIHYEYLIFCNKGSVGTTIESVTLEGEDAASFKLTGFDPRPFQLGEGECTSVGVGFRSHKIGVFSATLRIHPANPKVQDLTFPLSATTQRLPDLSLDVKNVRLGKLAGDKAILGEVVVKNKGLGISHEGATLTVKVSAYLSSDKSVPVTILEVALPALKPGEKRTLRFASKKHNFAASISKIISAKVTGSKRQRGLDRSESTFSDYEYFES